MSANVFAVVSLACVTTRTIQSAVLKAKARAHSLTATKSLVRRATRVHAMHGAPGSVAGGVDIRSHIDSRIDRRIDSRIAPGSPPIRSIAAAKTCRDEQTRERSQESHVIQVMTLRRHRLVIVASVGHPVPYVPRAAKKEGSSV